MSRLYWTSLYCLLAIFMSACGDAFNKEDKAKEEFNQFSTCRLDMESISKIMTKNIQSDLLCLESNLYLFIEMIKSDRPGYLNREALEIYLRENEKEVSKSTFDVLSGVFELNSILFGDQPNYISKENVKKLSAMLVEFNRIVVEGSVFNYFSSDEKVSYYEHNKRKSILHNALDKIGKLISQNIVDNKNEIEFSAFIEKFKNKDNIKHIQNAKKILFLKKAILGGNSSTLNAQELKRSMLILGDIGKVVYDIANLPDTKAEENEFEEIVKILKEDTLTIIRNLFVDYGNRNDIIVNYDQIKDVIESFSPELMKYLQYKKSFLKIKEILLGNANSNFTIGELDQLLKDVILENLSKGVFAYRSYLNNESIFGKLNRIYRDLKKFITFEDEEEKYINDINRIAKNYRFFQGTNFSPMFGFDYVRNPKGVFDIYLYEQLVTYFYKFYGTPDKSVQGGFYLTMNQLQQVMLDFSEILEGQGFLLPGRSAGTAETITIMTSLFHAQSNGDSKIEIPELVEFLVTITTAMSYAKTSQIFMQEKCSQDEKGRVHPHCFRENFVPFLKSMTKSNQSVDHFLPLLIEYLNGFNSEAEIDEYLIATSLFSRACSRFSDGSEIPMKYGDFLVTWAGLLVVEQSMLKFDENQNGVLEVREVDKAYEIYENAIKGLIPVETLKSVDSFANALFKYLVKYNRAPELPKVEGFTTAWRYAKQMGHFGYFYSRGLLPYGKDFQDANANRMTFASVLKVIAQNAATKRAPYKCDFLR